MSLSSSLTARLAKLVSFDTQNPSGDERPLVEFLATELTRLGAAQVVVQSVERHAWVYARFGKPSPKLLLNAHVDTVPANTGYSHPPHQLVERDGKLFGIGTADTKGAIAAILEALAARQAALLSGATVALDSVAVLFSGDEERRGTCMRHFLTESPHGAGIEQAIVCEPTGCAVGWRHRGIAAAEMVILSEGGHSSRADVVPNPVALLARAAVALDDFGKRHKDSGPAGFKGLCLNVASIDGGLAFNVIPTQGALRVSLRPAPGADLDAVMAEAEQIARAALPPDAPPATWTMANANPTFQTRNPAAFEQWLGAAARTPIDLAFWTEAALLSEAGIDAVVFGPGRIEQAHAADEFVARDQLEAAFTTFQRVLA